LLKLFTTHPHSVGETYLQHMRMAIGLALKCQMAVVAQFVHAIFPFINPPLRCDVQSLIDYLEMKKPSARKGTSQ